MWNREHNATAHHQVNTAPRVKSDGGSIIPRGGYNNP